jgi:hypothetical protein
MWILGSQSARTLDVKALVYRHDLAREAIKHAVEHLFDFVSCAKLPAWTTSTVTLRMTMSGSSQMKLSAG